MRHLTPADYRRMPWANGRGVTVEMARADGPGGMLWRLSMARVDEDGPFSIFPGVERSLTVISGPGFDLRGEGFSLRADPLIPVTFPGDVAISAHSVTQPCEDVNVMTARSLPRPVVTVEQTGAVLEGAGLLCLMALAPAEVNGVAAARFDLIQTVGRAVLEGGPVLAIRLFV
jgi:environmental stress-induced protein Ves